MAIADLNDAGGIKVGGKTYKFKLFIRDDRTDVDTAIAAARAETRGVPKEMISVVERQLKHLRSTG